MATKNLANCLKLGKTVQYSDAVTKAVENNDQPAMAKALEAQIQQVEQRQAAIEAQADTFLQGRVSASVAYKLTNRPDDPANELNDFEPVGFTKLIKNLVQRTGSVVNALTRTKQLKQNELTEAEIAVIKDFAGNFGEEASAAIDRILDPKKGSSWEHRREDMMQFLLERTDNGYAHSKTAAFAPLDPSVKDAIAATIYELLGSNKGILEGQDDTTIKQLLGLDRKAPIPKAAGMLEGVGANVPALAKQLGSTILQRISIVPTDSADHLAKKRLEMSLGLMAVATLEEMGFVKREELYLGKLTEEEHTKRKAARIKAKEQGKPEPAYEFYEGQFGIEAILSDDSELTRDDVFYEPEYDDKNEVINKKTGTPTMKTVKLTKEFAQRAQEIEDRFKLGRKAFDKLFNSESEHREIYWDVPLQYIKGKLKIGRTGENASELHARNLKKYIQMPYQASQETMALFQALDEDTILTILGQESPDGKLNVRKKSVEGINRGIERDLKALRNWLAEAEARKERGESQAFYILSKFQNNMRMNQIGEINPQNSKLHRNLFSPLGWEVAFSTTPASSFTRKKGTERAFLEAVAFAFDIESGKVGGPVEQLKELDIILNHPEKLQGPDDKKRLQKHYDLVAALNVLQNYHNDASPNKALSAEDQAIVARGVAATGTKMHGFKGLNEYARYLNHRSSRKPGKGKFKTDLYKEIDGVSNGPIIGAFQLIPDSANKQAVLATLAMGGISVNPKEVNLDELLKNKNLNDAYQRMGQIWAEELLLMKDRLRRGGEETATEYEQAMAIHRLIGSFVSAEGYIEKKIRNLSKPRTMQITYGAGVPRQTELFALSDVVNDGIYQKMEDLMNNTNELAPDLWQAELENLIQDINTLIGKPVYSVKNFQKNGKFSKAEMAKFRLERWQLAKILEAIKPTQGDTVTTYGDAMKAAIDSVYSDLIAARKPFNDSVQYGATIYNLALHKKVTALIEAHKAEGQTEPERITVAEMDEILKSINHLLPRIKTPLDRKGDPSAQVLTKTARRPPAYAADQNKGEQRGASSDLVSQNYKKKQMPLLSGYVEGIPYLEPPGVSPMVKTIQMLDSMVANHLMGISTNILNNHDGFSHAIDRADIIGHEANTVFHRLMKDYSLGQAFADAHNEMIEQRQEAILDLSISNEELVEAFIEDGLIDLDFYGKIEGLEGPWREPFQEEIFKEIKENGGDYQTVLKARLREIFAEKDAADVVEFLGDQVGKAATDMAEQTTRNKDEITSAVTEVAQYSNNGKGIVITLDNYKEVLFGDVDVNTVLSLDAAATEKTVSSMKELVDSVYDTETRGSSAGTVDTDPSAYPNPEVINKANVTQVFETILNLDDQVPHARIDVSTGHREHLKNILDQIVSKVMNPVEMFKAQHKLQDETRGLYTIDEKTGNKIWIQTQDLSTHPKPGMLTQGIRMSAAEVYTHEMVHHVTHYGLKNSNHLRRQVANLYELARDSFEDLYGANAFRVFMNNPNQDLSQADPYEVMAAKERWEYLFNPKQRDDKTHTGYDEFISFGLTNENFRRELGKLVVDDKTITARKALTGIFQKDLQTTVVNLFNRIMDFVHQTFYKQSHSTRVDQELENLAKALSEVDARSKTAVFKSLKFVDEKSTALGIKIDEKIKDTTSALLTGNKTRAHEKIQKMTAIRDRMQKQGLAVNQWPADVTAEFDKLNQEVNGLLAKEDTLIVKKVGDAFRLAKEFPKLDNILSYQTRRVLNWYNDSEQGLIASIVTEMKGTTERLKPLHQLLNKRNHVIDHAKNEARAVMMKVLNDAFERDLNNEEKVSITKGVFKTDLSALQNEVSFGALKDFIQNKAVREAKIKDIIREINADPALKPFRHFFENAADDLGFWMIHSATRDGSMPFFNAHNIVKMDMTSSADALAGHPSYETAVKLVDQLATLSSLRYLAPIHGQTLVQLMEEFPSAMEDVMTQHNTIKAKALEDNFNGSAHLMQKGYIKSILNPRIKYEQAYVADPNDPNDPTRVKYENMGYIMQDSPLKRDPNDPVQDDIYIFKSVLGSINDLQSGIASTRRHSAKGKSQYDIQRQMGNTADPSRKAARNERIMMKHTADTLNKMFKPRRTAPQLKPSTNFMVPKFNRDGKMIAMRYVMNEHTKDSMLQQFTEFDSVLAGMASDIVEKKFTPEINKDLIYALREMYDHPDHGFKAQPDAFVEISPFSDNPRYRDIYHMLPPKAQEQVLSQWGAHKMMVPRDVVDLAFGQRKYSIVEMFGKTAKERNLFESIMNEVLMFALGVPNPLGKNVGGSESAKRARVINRAKSIEDFMIQLTKLGKANVIVRNIAVSRGNYASNMALLKSQGIPMHKISTLSQEAITSALLYQKQKTELETLKAQRPVIARKHSLPQSERDRLIKEIDRKILRYEDALARNKSAKLIESGLMPAVVDDVHTETIDQPFKFGLDAGIDKGLSKLPSKVEKAGRVLFMTDDTEGYKMLNNAVKMTDYVARYVLYRHLTADNKMSHDDAVSYAMDKFINFDIPTHRTLQYLNDIGLVWYSKYQLRVLKHIKNTLKENPFTTMATYLLGMAVGNNNILNSVPAITKDVGQGFGDPASVFADSVDQIFYADMVQSAAMYPFE